MHGRARTGDPARALPGAVAAARARATASHSCRGGGYPDAASGWQREFFIGIAVVASVWITYMLVRHAGERLFCFALALILGGAIGNVIEEHEAERKKRGRGVAWGDARDLLVGDDPNKR